MPHIHPHQSDYFRDAADLHPQRLVCVEDDHDGGASNAETREYHLAHEAILQQTTRSTAEQLLQTYIQNGEIPEDKRAEILRAWQAEHATNQTGAEEAEQPNTNNDQVAALRKLEEKKEEIGEELRAEVDHEYIQNLATLRASIRHKIEACGIDFSTESRKKNLKIHTKIHQIQKSFHDAIVAHIEGSDRGHQNLRQEITDYHAQEKRVYAKAKVLFDKSDWRPFLEMLKRQEIPSDLDKDEDGIKPNVDILIEAIDHMNGKWDQDDGEERFWGLFGEDLEIFDYMLDSAKGIYDTWQNAEAKSNKDIRDNLEDYESRVRQIQNATDEPRIATALFLPTNANERDKVFDRYRGDINNIKEKLKNPNLSEADRKFITTYLQQGLTATAAKLENIDRIDQIIKAEKEAELARIREEAGTTGQDSTTATNDNEEPAEAEKREEFSKPDTLIRRGIQLYADVMTMKGRITWYSWHELKKEFGAIGEIVKTHYTRKWDDKLGGVRGDIIKHAHPELYAIHEERARDGFRKAADEIMPIYKNYPIGLIYAELEDSHLNVTKFRALLGVLADRGALHMSDKRLIDAVCKYGGEQLFSEADWKEANANLNYDKMKKKFRKVADKKTKEIGFADDLIGKHDTGVSNAEKRGESLVGSANQTSVVAEVGAFLDKANVISIEGEAALAGIIKKMTGRANGFSYNKQKAKIDLKVDSDTEHEYELSADLGTVAMKLVELYARGELTPELIGHISKTHENIYRPLCVLQDMIVKKLEKDDAGNKITYFEKWGWINKEKGYLTKLGFKEMPKYFNTRNAETADGKIVHIAIGDATSGTYQTHSKKCKTCDDLSSHGSDKVGDKLIGNIAKNASSDLFKSATEKSHDGRVQSQAREISSLIRSQVENFDDGAKMQNRYYDEETKVELKTDEEIKEAELKGTKRDYGADMKKEAKNNLVMMLNNMYQNFSNKDVADRYVTYGYEDQQNNVHNNLSLQEYLHGALNRYEGTSEYREIMAAFTRFNSLDPTVPVEDRKREVKAAT